MPDIFISYAHVDKHWVDLFVPLLEQRVNQAVGRAKPERLWKDNRFSGNEAISPAIAAQLAQTQCLVSILSPGYLASPWCMQAELATFYAQVGDHSGRIFAVELEALAPEHKPAAIASVLGYRFWRQEALSKRTYPLQTHEPEFERTLIDLAKDIAQVLTPPSSPRAVTVEHGRELSTLQSLRLSAFQQQKQQALQKQCTLLLELLARQQEELTFADDPRRQMKLERDIKITQTSLTQVEAELKTLGF